MTKKLEKTTKNNIEKETTTENIPGSRRAAAKANVSQTEEWNETNSKKNEYRDQVGKHFFN